MKASSSKGFTLVEVLIVIAVIGILAAMVMPSSKEAVSAARASSIMNSLQNWKIAAMAWYSDHRDKVNIQGRIRTSSATAYTGEFSHDGLVKADDLFPYLNGGITLDADGKSATDVRGGKYTTDYNATGSGGDYRMWLIKYTMPTDDTLIKEKLAARAAYGGLINKQGNPYTVADGNDIYLMVINFTK